MRLYVPVKARDGYAAVFALPEFDDTQHLPDLVLLGFSRPTFLEIQERQVRPQRMSVDAMSRLSARIVVDLPGGPLEDRCDGTDYSRRLPGARSQPV
jgi:hypothetical protein